MFIKTDNENNIVTYPYNHDMYRAENKNKSLPKVLNNDYLATEYVFPVYPTEKPEFNEATQQAIADANNPYLDEDGLWKYGWNVLDKTEIVIEHDTSIKARQVRKERDVLLTECDWATLKAADTATPIDEAWATYRQALRDITTQDGFPYTVTWPTKP